MMPSNCFFFYLSAYTNFIAESKFKDNMKYIDQNQNNLNYSAAQNGFKKESVAFDLFYSFSFLRAGFHFFLGAFQYR